MFLKNIKIFLFFVLISVVLFYATGCFFEDDDVVVVNNTYFYHNNIICTNFSILLDEDDLSSGDSAWGEKTEINPYYYALPFNNVTFKMAYEKGFKIPLGWSYQLLSQPVKNKWVEIINEKDGKYLYCQWEDVGPWFVEDFQYVFSAMNGVPEIRPKTEENIGEIVNLYDQYAKQGIFSKMQTIECNGAGIDISPTAMEYLTGKRNGKIKVKWRFVTEEEARSKDPMKLFWFKNVNRNSPPKNSSYKDEINYFFYEGATEWQ
ncbi:MAG: RlpA-like double-psi beta-barrel domain-containing protein [Candidatus Muirbacterium halophilum]|nr:RlpA-like double-psi beta-barrel domain-containing protein [Candidatus Muirbacterium halophilum]